MNLDFTQYLPADFNPDSRVWIYQSSRAFSKTETHEINMMLSDFAGGWKSHGARVKGFGIVLFDLFILLMADETASGVSGCSTDSSVRLIKEIENIFKVDMFNRQSLAFIVKEKIEQIPLHQLEYAVQNGFISSETLYFNNVVLSKKEMEINWILQLKNSWLAKKLIS